MLVNVEIFGEIKLLVFSESTKFDSAQPTRDATTQTQQHRPEPPAGTPPGMLVKTWYINSTTGTSSKWHVRMYLWWSLCTLCLPARQVKLLTVGDSGLLLRPLSVERYYLPLLTLHGRSRLRCFSLFVILDLSLFIISDVVIFGERPAGVNDFFFGGGDFFFFF